MSTAFPRSAGWYDDEADASRLRYWDGNAWSPHTAPRPTDAPDASAAAAPAAPAAPVVSALPPGPVVAPPAPIIPPLDVPEESGFDAIEEATTARPFPARTLDSELPAATIPGMPGRGVEEHTTVPSFSYAPYQTAGRTFIATWLFALLLGFWGADRFYLGKVGTAILKLVTLGGLGVWVLVDLVLVLAGAQRDRNGLALAGYEEHRRVAWIVTGVLVGFSLLTSIVSSVVAALTR